MVLRQYQTIVERLESLPRQDWRLTQITSIWDYPWYTIERVLSKSLPTVFLSSGMHGEEPAGVEGVLRWLERGRWRKWDVNWLILPCINPYGWERNQRRNRQNRDINRQFRFRTNTPESELIKQLVKGRRFLFSMEFHEDVDATGFYFYELRRKPPYIGERVLQAVSRVAPINRDLIIDGNEATGQGLIRREIGINAMRTRERWPMAFYLYRHCTDHILGCESALTLPVKIRARAHNVALAKALDLVLPR